MKILFLSNAFYPDIGGIESVSDILADAFTAEFHEVRLLTWTAEIGNRKFPFKVIRRPTIKNLFKEILWADLVFENNPCIRMSWPNLLLNKPIVTALHTWIAQVDGSVGRTEKFKRLIVNRSDAVIACSMALKKLTSPKADVIGNPYNDKLFRIKDDIKKEKDFIFLGRLVSDKGAIIAIEAFKLYCEKHPDENTSLTIVGDGEERAKLEDFVKKYNLGSKVTFKGSMSGELLSDELNRHRYLLVTSIWDEPFGLVVLEGMACGCVPIASNNGGLPDAVGNAGMLFEKGDIESLYECMVKVRMDLDTTNKLKNNALEHLKQHQLLQVSQRYLNVFKKVLNPITIS